MSVKKRLRRYSCASSSAWFTNRNPVCGLQMGSKETSAYTYMKVYAQWAWVCIALHYL